MKSECEICRGARIVRLPIYRPVSAAAFDASAAIALDASWREYPCPECGGAVKEDRIAVLDTHAMVDIRIDDPEFQRHAQRTAAHMLVDRLLDGGYITFERGKHDPNRFQYPMVATLGVVARRHVATIEERATSRGRQLASAVADEAIKQIDNWGAHYGHSDILKRDARRFIHEAVKSVSEGWSKAMAVRDGGQN